MKRVVLLVAAILFALPAIAGAQSKPADDGGNAIKDSWITSKTKMSLATDKRVKARHITVETDAGIVALRGKVSSASERGAAERITKKIKGVKGVSNALQVVPDSQRKTVDARDSELEEAVRTRLMNDAALRTATIHVRADNAVVTLMGKVHDVHGMARASDIARGIRGVKAVRNELRQES